MVKKQIKIPYILVRDTEDKVTIVKEKSGEEISRWEGAEILDRKCRDGLTEKTTVTNTRRKWGREACRCLGLEIPRRSFYSHAKGLRLRLPPEFEGEQENTVAGK